MVDLIKALVKTQSEIHALKIQKDSKATVVTKKGGKYSYSYVSLGEVYDNIIPVLNKNGFVVTQNSSFDVIQGVTFCMCETTLSHISGQEKIFISRMPYAAFERMNVPQSAGSHFTYLNRYALSSIFLIAADDNDGAGDHAPRETYKQPQRNDTPNNVDMGNSSLTVDPETVKKIIMESILSTDRKNQIWENYQSKPEHTKQVYFDSFIMTQVNPGRTQNG